ncbi:DNA translocase FtsK [Spirillospora sp. NPDC052242]
MRTERGEGGVVQPGLELAGRYRLDELLGRGGMGEVWRGLDLALDRPVAVKVLLRDRHDEPEAARAMARFRREGRAAARLSHPAIAAVHDVGEDDGRPFLVLELLDGRNLREVLSRHPGGLPVERVADYGAQTAAGLAAAHAAGVVHRDIKPANLILLPDGRVKICDFGIARLEGATAGLSVTGARMGTVAYMPPEQAEGKPLDGRADLYALGCTLFHMLTGRYVFTGDGLGSVVAQHLARPAPSPRELRPDIPAELDELVRSLLAKDPGDRPSDAAAVARVLERVGRPSAWPGLSLLSPGGPARPRTEANDAVVRLLTGLLGRLAIDARVTGFTRGPTVSRYEIEVGDEVGDAETAAFTEHVERTIAGARILRGGPAMRVEIPNDDRETVALGAVLRHPVAAQQRHPLVFGLGKDVTGAAIAVNAAKLPHLLVAGDEADTSASLNGMITSILLRAEPDRVRMLLADARPRDLTRYDGVPHLLRPVITDAREAVEALAWVLAEMDRRYDHLAASGHRHIDDLNRAIGAGEEASPGRGDTPYPYVLAVVRELAGPMAAAPRDAEDAIVRITRLARAAGIHLVLATRRPSAGVVTEPIKANVPSRLAFTLPSAADSRAVLERPGAERLLGNGDALFLPMGTDVPIRVQHAHVSADEIAAVVAHRKT